MPTSRWNAQLAGFPEVHWAVTPFSLARPRNEEKQTDLDTSGLKAAMAPFFGAAEGKEAGFLASPAWRVLQKHIEWPGRDGVLRPESRRAVSRLL